MQPVRGQQQIWVITQVQTVSDESSGRITCCCWLKGLFSPRCHSQTGMHIQYQHWPLCTFAVMLLYAPKTVSFASQLCTDTHLKKISTYYRVVLNQVKRRDALILFTSSSCLRKWNESQRKYGWSVRKRKEVKGYMFYNLSTAKPWYTHYVFLSSLGRKQQHKDKNECLII